MSEETIRRARYDRQEEFRCVRFDRQRHEGAGKEDDARGRRSMKEKIPVSTTCGCSLLTKVLLGKVR